MNSWSCSPVISFGQVLSVREYHAQSSPLLKAYDELAVDRAGKTYPAIESRASAPAGKTFNVSVDVPQIQANHKLRLGDKPGYLEILCTHHFDLVVSYARWFFMVSSFRENIGVVRSSTLTPTDIFHRNVGKHPTRLESGPPGGQFVNFRAKR